MPIGSAACVPHVAYEFMKTRVAKTAPLAVLDLGVGWGWLGCACRQWLDLGVVPPPEYRTHVTGVEAWVRYASPAWATYDAIEVRDIQSAVLDWRQRLQAGHVFREPWAPRYGFDAVAVLDVIEHFEKQAGEELLVNCQDLLTPGGVFVVATPAIWMPQQDVYGNAAERHRSLWTAADFATRPGWRVLKDGSLDEFENMMLCTAWTKPT